MRGLLLTFCASFFFLCYFPLTRLSPPHPLSRGQDKWDGHSSLVRELAADRRLQAVQPAGRLIFFVLLPSFLLIFHDDANTAVICSVGGGGLLNGISEGLHRFADWTTVPIVACETDGSRCLANSMLAGSVVALPAITTIARSLGALRCSERTMKVRGVFFFLSLSGLYLYL